MMIGKTVAGNMGNTNKNFDFEVKFYNMTNIQTQFYTLAHFTPNGSGTSHPGGISVYDIIPGFGAMTATEKKAAIASLPLKEDGEERIITAASTSTQVTARETTIAGTYTYNGTEFNYRIFVYNDTAQGLCGVCEERTYGTTVLTDIENVPEGVTRTAKGTYEFSLKHNEVMTFEELPHGITYTVSEKSANSDNYATTATAQLGSVWPDTKVHGTLTDNESITYTNTRESVSPTGVGKTNKIMLAFALLLGAALYAIMKRRKKQTDQ